VRTVIIFESVSVLVPVLKIFSISVPVLKIFGIWVLVILVSVLILAPKRQKRIILISIFKGTGDSVD